MEIVKFFFSVSDGKSGKKAHDVRAENLEHQWNFSRKERRLVVIGGMFDVEGHFRVKLDYMPEYAKNLIWIGFVQKSICE